MPGFDMSEMQEMQKALQDKYKHKWEPICPEIGQNKLLWMIGEIGEVIDIVKKHGGEKASSDRDLRRELVEELADVLMYYNDVLLCYGISAEEALAKATDKFIARFAEVEEGVLADGKEMSELSLEELDTYWDAAKMRKNGENH